MSNASLHSKQPFLRAFRCALVSVGLLLLPCVSAAAGKLKVLYDFCSKGSCSRSFSPAGLLLDQSGNIYGTRDNSGTDGKGIAFKLSFDGAEWKYQTLHEFCSAVNCTDGAQPEGGLIIDGAGNLYGTTASGGNTNHGVFFEITSAGTYEVLYSFCPDGETCSDGAAPLGALTYAGAQTGEPYDGYSPLFGTGAVSYNGIVFELAQTGEIWSSTTIYSFAKDGQDCSSDSAIMDASGNLFGAIKLCGDGNQGNVFVLGNGQDGWTEISHYSFSGGDGWQPYGPLIEDPKGRLYVAAEMGGKYADGVIVRLSPVVDTYLQKVLHSFRWSEGAWPMGGLIADSSGNFFGTTDGGGKGSGATVLELSDGKFQVLYQFCLHDAGCRSGARPVGGVILDAAGNLYGTTTEGGKNGFGTIFEITNEVTTTGIDDLESTPYNNALDPRLRGDDISFLTRAVATRPGTGGHGETGSTAANFISKPVIPAQAGTPHLPVSTLSRHSMQQHSGSPLARE